MHYLTLIYSNTSYLLATLLWEYWCKKNDCELVAKKNNIEFKWNVKFPINSLQLMRGYLIINQELKTKFFDLCFDYYWKENVDLEKKETSI